MEEEERGKGDRDTGREGGMEKGRKGGRRDAGVKQRVYPVGSLYV